MGRSVTKTNDDLTNEAVKAKNTGYISYGKMQAEEYAKIFTSGIKEAAAEHRKNGYMTVRERMKLKEQQEEP